MSCRVVANINVHNEYMSLVLATWKRYWNDGLQGPSGVSNFEAKRFLKAVLLPLNLVPVRLYTKYSDFNGMQVN